MDDAPELAGDWELDAEPAAEEPPPGTAGVPPAPPGGRADAPGHPEGRTAAPRPAGGTPAVPGGAAPGSPPPDEVPTPEQVVEALLFVGGRPLTAGAACGAVRGLTPEGFRAAVDALAARYRRQGRPYAVEARGDGFALVPLAAFRAVRERLFGGPRQARLTPPMLDVLAVVAYRQPVGKAEVDAARGADSGGVLRGLVRLGLVAVTRAADTRETRYSTTPRFLDVLGLGSMDELPRPADTERVH